MRLLVAEDLELDPMWSVTQFFITARCVSLWFVSEFVSAKLHLQSPDIGIDFLLDDTSLVELSDQSDWKQEADQRIQQLRMGNIHFR